MVRGGDWFRIVCLRRRSYCFDMSAEEKRVEELEAWFAESAGDAFALARARAFETQEWIVEAADGGLYEVRRDGKRKLLKRIAPPVPVRKGARFVIK